MRNPSLPMLIWSSLRRSRSKASDPFEPLISQANAFLRPVANRVASIVPTAPFSKRDRGLERVVDLAPGLERGRQGGDGVDLADEVPGEVDDVRPEVAERARAGAVLLEAPRLVARRTPLLEVAAAEVVDLAELAGLDHLAGEPHGGHEAVVEGAHVDDARLRHALPDLVRLRRVTAQRLLADDVLAGLRRGDRRLGVEVVRAAVVEEPDLRVLDDGAPVGDGALEPVAPSGLGDGRLVPARDRHEPRQERGRPGHVRERPEAVGVRLSHERVAEHPDPDLVDLLGAGGAAHRGEAGLVGHGQSSFRCMAASKASSEAGKSVRRTWASASCAPYSRSIPESSHSTESGPV